MIDKSSDRFLSIRIARRLMKVIGIWPPETKKEQKILNYVLTYTIFSICCAIWIVTSEFYLSLGDFYALAYTLCNSISVLIVVFKIVTFLYHKKRILKLLSYTQDHFWYRKYDEFGTEILEKTNKKGLLLISMFTFFVLGTITSYLLNSIGENIGRNSTNRILIFNVWIGLPLDVSPNFEIVYAFEVLALLYSGICFCGFDNLFGLLNIHAAAQFKILSHRIRMILKNNSKEPLNESKWDKRSMEFRSCVLHHYALISYMENMERVFKYALMMQLIFSSIMLCVTGFQVLVGHQPIMRRILFTSDTIATFFQLFVITITATEVLVESQAVGEAAYGVNWQDFLQITNKDIKHNIVLMIIRSSRPCTLTAGGVFPVSLETFSKVLSTSASYFTLLRKFEVEQ